MHATIILPACTRTPCLAKLQVGANNSTIVPYTHSERHKLNDASPCTSMHAISSTTQ